MPADLPAVSFPPARRRGLRVVHSFLDAERSEILDRACAMTRQHPDKLVNDAVNRWLDAVEKSGVID